MLRDQFIQKFTEYSSRLIPQNSSVLVALSSGPDSMALLYALHYSRADLKLKRIYIAHVNHQLRGEESDQDQSHAKFHAKVLNLPIFIKQLSGKKLHDSGLEEWARNERYAFFTELRNSLHCNLIATGHNKNDQAETVLMRLFRGGTLKSLAGILPLREDGVCRPLLWATRNEIITFLKDNSISFRTDSSNSDQFYKRNWIRHAVLPLIESHEPSIINHLVDYAQQAQALISEDEVSIKKWIDENKLNKAFGFDINKTGLNQKVAIDALHEIFLEYHIPSTKIHLQEIIANSEKSSGEYLLPSGWKYYPGENHIHFSKQKANPDKTWSYKLSVPGITEIPELNAQIEIIVKENYNNILPTDNWTVVIPFTQDILPLSIRLCEKTDRFKPFGMKQSLLISDFLKKSKIPKFERERTCVVVKDDEVVWIPKVRLSENFRVLPSTKTTIFLQYKEL